MIKRMIRRLSKPCPTASSSMLGRGVTSTASIPDNVFLESWFPQPSVVEQSSLFIHHGGNNSFCEALYFGVPSLVMPFCWDGHDNARRAEDVGVGRRLDRYRWTGGELAAAITGLLDNSTLHDTLAANSATMKRAAGVTVAAKGDAQSDLKKDGEMQDEALYRRRVGKA